MQLILAPFSHWPESFFAFAFSTVVVVVMIFIVLRSAMSVERKPRWVRWLTSVNAKFLFTFLFIGWAIVFGIGLQLVPHTGANSPYGALGLIALFSGFFIMMGLLWAVIGE